MHSQHTVIIGGSSGIGLATAGSLLASGGKVTIAARSAARLSAAAETLGHGVQTEIIDATLIKELPDRFAAIGTFDHLVLALGSGRGVGPFAQVSLADVKLGFEEKVYAHFAAAQAALPFLNPKGSLTFIAAAPAARPGTAGIAAANAAVAALVPVLAIELKPLRVNAVLPGVIDTPWWSALPEERRAVAFEASAAKTPVGRIGRPEDVAKAIAFLIDDDFVSGVSLICDGGLRLAP